jgi:hypothetical protein
LLKSCFITDGTRPVTSVDDLAAAWDPFESDEE